MRPSFSTSRSFESAWTESPSSASLLSNWISVRQTTLSRMAKRIHISRYYADDKDIEDVVSQNVIKPQQLAAFIRERGIIVSNRMSKEDLIRYFRFLRLAWPDFDSLLARLDRPDREEDFTGCRLKARGLSLETVMERLETIRHGRAERLGEVHKAER